MKNQITNFLNKVQEMRQAQKAYFRFQGDAEHKKRILIRSKSLETDVDIEAERLQSALAPVDNLTLSERARVIGELTLLSPKLDRLSMSFVDQLIEELKADFNKSPKSIIHLEAERFAWSRNVFPEATAISSLRKLESEIKEVEANINKGIQDPEEFADMLMCLFDSAGRNGILPAQIFSAFENKLAINKARSWIKNQDNSYSHIKEDLK